MSISSQLPPLPLAQASASLRALAQNAGQNVEAKVIAQQPNGMTQVQIGRQVISLNLPTPQVPGTVLNLSVQQADGQLRLSIVSTMPPPQSATIAPPGAANPLAPPQSPATSVQISSLATPTPTNTAPAAAPGYGAGATPPSAALQPNIVQQAVAASIPVSANAAPAGQVAQPAQPVPVATQGQAPAAPAAAPVAGVVAPVAPGGVAGPVAHLVPYAAAAAAVPAVAPPAQGATSSAMPPVQQATVSTHVGQHAPAPNFPGAGGTLPPTASATPMASTPQAALAQMVQQSMPSQNSIVALTSTLTAIAGKVALPEAVAKAAQQVMGHRLDGGRIDGAALQKAIQGSGIFQEASLAAGRPNAAGGDLKTALLGLQQRLGQWLGAQGPVEQVAKVPPPLRGITPRARAGEGPPPDLPLDPVEVGKVLQEQTHAALSRLRLHQNASLPDTATARQEAQWSLDLPISTGTTQALLHLQIHHDGQGDNTRPEDRGWQVRFAINLNEMGEVGAQISMRGKITGVMLWAEQKETADALAASVAELRGELEAVGLAPGTVMVRTGAPAPMPAPSPTHFVDEVR